MRCGSQELSPFFSAKSLVHWDRIKKIAEGEIPYPVSAEIDPSNLCNHRCEWCMFKAFKQKHPDSLSEELMISLIKELKDVGVKAITFTGGGEPLMNSSTRTVMLYCKSLGIECGLVTNGGLIDKFSKTIGECCRFVRISLDAGSPETHKAVHNPASGLNYQEILEEMKSLKNAYPGLVVGASFLVCNKNYSEVYKASENVMKTGADYIQIRPVIQGITLSQANVAQAQIFKAKKKLESENFKVYGIMHRFSEVIDMEKRFTKCRATPLITNIGADGNVYICCQLRGNPKFIIGNIKEKSFREIWSSKKHKNVINSINIEKCPVCRYIPYNELIEKIAVKDDVHRNFL